MVRGSTTRRPAAALAGWEVMTMPLGFLPPLAGVVSVPMRAAMSRAQVWGVCRRAMSFPRWCASDLGHHPTILEAAGGAPASASPVRLTCACAIAKQAARSISPGRQPLRGMLSLSETLTGLGWTPYCL